MWLFLSNLFCILCGNKESFKMTQSNDPKLPGIRRSLSSGTITACQCLNMDECKLIQKTYWFIGSLLRMGSQHCIYLCPKCLERTVLKLAHKSLISGQFVIRKTLGSRVLFAWSLSWGFSVPQIVWHLSKNDSERSGHKDSFGKIIINRYTVYESNSRHCRSNRASFW